MKKIIFLLAMTTFLFSDFAMQAQSKKELRAKRRAHRECMRMHNRMVREQQNMIAYQDAVKPLKVTVGYYKPTRCSTISGQPFP